MGNNERTAIRLLSELVDFQNGAPLERDKEEYNKLMDEIYSFLDDIADREIIESVIDSHSPTTEQPDTLCEGDWFQGTEEDYRTVLELQGDYEEAKVYMNYIKENGLVFSEKRLKTSFIQFNLNKTQLTPEEFLRRAENTFKNQNQ